ncbi:MAG TPA: DUF4266 domain-containing protein [Gammaproteobacteria bacterium]|nr:DUF4266 domain-containing protein [Gammaproteobacteria bacterium]
MFICLLVPLMLALGGCSSMGVKPWERDLLAKPEMQPVPNYFENFYDEHIYFSKEASRGGQGVGGGGCGCN